MLKYAKIEDEETKVCSVGTGDNAELYQSLGMTLMDVEKTSSGDWYVSGYAPEGQAPTKEKQSHKRELDYAQEVDPITCHINRLKDEEQTPEIIAEIEELKQQRDKLVEDIKQRYPYPEEA